MGGVAGVVFGVYGYVVLDLEFDPGGRLEIAALDVAFPGQRELDGDDLARVDKGGQGGGGSLAVVVGVIFEEVEGFRLWRFVFKFDAGCNALSFQLATLLPTGLMSIIPDGQPNGRQRVCLHGANQRKSEGQ